MSEKAPTQPHPRIAVLGSRSGFTRQTVDALCTSGVPPAALVIGASPSSDARGRIPVEAREPEAGLASAHGISLIRTSDPNHPDAIAALKRIEPDLLLLACLPRIVGRATLETARLGALNLHPSALPRFRGPNPVFWQLREGVARAGVTVHVAIGAVDAGPIVTQRWLDVPAGIGAGALTTALVRRGVRALVETLPEIEQRMREATPQDDSAATRQPYPHADALRLDTTWTAERAYRFIEGIRGPGTTFTILSDEGALEVERAIGFDAHAKTEPSTRGRGEILTIRFAQGILRAVPARRRAEGPRSCERARCPRSRERPDKPRRPGAKPRRDTDSGSVRSGSRKEMGNHRIRHRRVLVTGASGRIGRHVVDALVDDCEVTALDLAPPVQDVPFIEGDVLDLQRVRAAMTGQDAVIHLAALDIGVPAEPEGYFGVNVMGTWNTLQAAREAGIRKVVLASSISATGIGEMRSDFPPEYLPVDEAHAMKPAHAYGLGKLVLENVARGFVRQGDVSVICLRPVAVIFESNLRRTVDRAADAAHPWLAAYVTGEDTGRAFAAALDHDAPFDALFIAADDSASPVPTLERLAGVYGAEPPVRNPGWFERNPLASPIDATRAKQRLGWRPTSTWAEVAARLDG